MKNDGKKKDKTTNKNVISPTFGYKLLMNKFKNSVILFFIRQLNRLTESIEGYL